MELEPCAVLPTSWRACRRLLGHFGVGLTAAETFGFGASLGWGYRAWPSPLLVGYGGFDPMKDLVLTIGPWFARQTHCATLDQALEGMRFHLRRERSPLIVALSPQPGDGRAESDLRQAARRTFVCVEAMDGEVVRGGLDLGMPAETMELGEFRRRLQGHEAAWCIAYGNGAVRSLAARLEGALFRAWQRLRSGWRQAPAGVAAFRDALRRVESEGPHGGLEETLALSRAMGGGFGRPLFASFLREHVESLPAAALDVAGHYEALGLALSELEGRLAEGRASAALVEDLARAEEDGLRRLGELCAALERRWVA